MLDMNNLEDEVWGWVPTNEPIFFITPWCEGSSPTNSGFGIGWPAPFSLRIPNAIKFTGE